MFVPLTDVIEGLSEEQLNRWERMYMVTINATQPLIYSHPESGNKVGVYSCYKKHKMRAIVLGKTSPKESTYLDRLEYIKYMGSINQNRWRAPGFIRWAIQESKRASMLIYNSACGSR